MEVEVHQDPSHVEVAILNYDTTNAVSEEHNMTEASRGRRSEIYPFNDLDVISRGLLVSTIDPHNVQITNHKLTSIFHALGSTGYCPLSRVISIIWTRRNSRAVIIVCLCSTLLVWTIALRRTRWIHNMQFVRVKVLDLTR